MTVPDSMKNSRAGSIQLQEGGEGKEFNILHQKHYGLSWKRSFMSMPFILFPGFQVTEVQNKLKNKRVVQQFIQPQSEGQLVVQWKKQIFLCRLRKAMLSYYTDMMMMDVVKVWPLISDQCFSPCCLFSFHHQAHIGCTRDQLLTITDKEWQLNVNKKWKTSVCVV